MKMNYEEITKMESKLYSHIKVIRHDFFFPYTITIVRLVARLNNYRHYKISIHDIEGNISLLQCFNTIDECFKVLEEYEKAAKEGLGVDY